MTNSESYPILRTFNLEEKGSMDGWVNQFIDCDRDEWDQPDYIDLDGSYGDEDEYEPTYYREDYD